jgi:hypothetical protein
MARSRRPEVEASQLQGLLLRRAAPWVVAAAASCVVVIAIVGGVEAGIGALVGALVVAVFYGTDLVVLRLVRGTPPPLAVLAFLSEYFVKVLLLAAALWALGDTETVDLQAAAITVVVTTVVVLVAVTVASLRTTSFILDPVPGQADRAPDDTSPTT